MTVVTKTSLVVFLFITVFLGFVSDRFEKDNRKLRTELAITKSNLSAKTKAFDYLNDEYSAQKQVCGGIVKTKTDSYELSIFLLEVSVRNCKKDKEKLQRRYNKLSKESKL